MIGASPTTQTTTPGYSPIGPGGQVIQLPPTFGTPISGIAPGPSQTKGPGVSSPAGVPRQQVGGGGGGGGLISSDNRGGGGSSVGEPTQVVTAQKEVLVAIDTGGKTTYYNAEEYKKQEAQKAQQTYAQLQQQVYLEQQEQARVKQISADTEKKPGQQLTSTPELAAFREHAKKDNPIQIAIEAVAYGSIGAIKKAEEVSPFFVSQVAAPAAKGAISFVSGVTAHPIEAVKSVGTFILNPVEETRKMQEGLSFMTATQGEVSTVSYLGGQFVAGEALGFAAKRTIEVGKDFYVGAGSKRLEPGAVFSKEVLEEGKTFATTSSTKEALARFNKNVKANYDLNIAEQLAKNPELYARPMVSKPPVISSEVLTDIKLAVPEKPIVLTGGAARIIATGEGKLRDLDIVTQEGKAISEAVAEKFPGKYEVVQHKTLKDIYRLKSKETGKIVADFDPIALAEEGLINPKKDIVRVGEQEIVSPELMLKSKAVQVLRGKTTTAKQAENILQLTGGKVNILKDEGVKVVTASPAKIQGLEVSEGFSTKAGLEDPGIYVTPKGEVSPYFTGLMEGAEYEFSLNPFKGLFDVPTVTEFRIAKVVTYPKGVALVPGFEQLTKYQEANVGKGLAYITKRSQVGTGDLPRQSFILAQEAELGGKIIPAGTIRVEAGTSEIEAVIGVGEQFKYTPKTTLGKIKGFEFYTEYAGRKIPIREAELLRKESKAPVPGEDIVISGEQVVKEQAAFESLYSGKKIVTPANLLSKGVSFASVAEGTSVVGGSNRISESSITYSNIGSAGSSAGSSVISSIGSSISKAISSGSGGSSAGSSIGSSASSSAGSKGGPSGGSSGGSSRFNIIPEVPTYPKPSIAPSKQPGTREGGFVVLVRRGGVFRPIVTTKTAEQAFVAGRTKVGLTAAASFKVRELGTRESVGLAGRQYVNPRIYYESRKEPGTFIQRRSFRISTPGEKREITYKGIQASRNKRRRLFK